LNIGIADVANPLNPLGLDYLPVIKLRQKADPTKEISTTDPGRALVTGKWKDIGKFKGPILRGLSARAPYFHNGSAETLKDVVELYNVRFGMGLTESEKADLAAFLSTL
jgi:cytochrome c peroxidase